MRVSLGDTSLSVSDLTAISDYQATNPPDQVPAGYVYVPNSASEMSQASVLVPATGVAAAGNWLQQNSGMVLAAVAVIGLVIGANRR